MSVDDGTLGRLVILTVVVVGFCLGSTVIAAETQRSSPEITITDVQVGVDETATAKIRLSSVPNGLAGYDITVTTGNSATIVNASLNDELRLTRTKITDDGRVALRGVDLEKEIEPGAGQITLATVTLRGTSSGETPLEVRVEAIDSDDGSAIDPTIDNATVKVGQTNNSATPTTNSDTPTATPTTDDTAPQTSRTSTNSPTSTNGPTSTDSAPSTGTSTGGSGGGIAITPTVVVMITIVLFALVGLLWVTR